MADNFRIRQAVADLTAVARRATVATLSRISDGAPVGRRDGMAAHLAAAIAANGRIKGPAEVEVRETALLAASLPDHDFDAFIASTALVLTDGLQGGGTDNLFWHWDAFQAHYALAPRPVRAAILQAYLTGAGAGRFSIEIEPIRAISTSEPLETVRDRLLQLIELETAGTFPRAAAAHILEAIESSVHLAEAASVWTKSGDMLQTARPIGSEAVIAGMRFLYERFEGFSPGPNPALLPPVSVEPQGSVQRA